MDRRRRDLERRTRYPQLSLFELQDQLLRTQQLERSTHVRDPIHLHSFSRNELHCTSSLDLCDPHSPMNRRPTFGVARDPGVLGGVKAFLDLADYEGEGVLDRDAGEDLRWRGWRAGGSWCCCRSLGEEGQLASSCWELSELRWLRRAYPHACVLLLGRTRGQRGRVNSNPRTQLERPRVVRLPPSPRQTLLARRTRTGHWISLRSSSVLVPGAPLPNRLFSGGRDLSLVSITRSRSKCSSSQFCSPAYQPADVAFSCAVIAARRSDAAAVLRPCINLASPDCTEDSALACSSASSHCSTCSSARNVC